MSPPTIPGGTTQAVAPQTGTYNFVQPWYAFFQSLLAYVSTGPIGPVPLQGVTDGSNAAAGIVGEYLSAFVLAGAAINLITDTDTQITSLALTAGDWDLSGEVFYQASGGTMNFYRAAIGTTVSTAPAAPSDGTDIARNTTTSSNLVAVPGMRTRISITTPTTYILTAQIDFTGGSVAGYGALRARRMR